MPKRKSRTSLGPELSLIDVDALAPEDILFIRTRGYTSTNMPTNYACCTTDGTWHYLSPEKFEKLKERLSKLDEFNPVACIDPFASEHFLLINHSQVAYYQPYARDYYHSVPPMLWRYGGIVLATHNGKKVYADAHVPEQGNQAFILYLHDSDFTGYIAGLIDKGRTVNLCWMPYTEEQRTNWFLGAAVETTNTMSTKERLELIAGENPKIVTLQHRDIQPELQSRIQLMQRGNPSANESSP